MATATKRSASPPPPAQPVRPGPFLRAFDAIFRFLASLKLAVISLSSLAAVLAVGTWVESRYGTVAVQEWVYQSWWFALLLAFLASNILCAALIRYPWTRRQRGFVITHAGLLTVLAGSFWSFQHSEEGQVALGEGESTEQLVRPDRPVIRVREVDPHTQKPIQDFEYLLQFRPGALPWGPGRYEVLSEPKGPFKLAVKRHLTASGPTYLHEAVENGVPMLKVGGLFVKAPNQLRESDILESEEDPQGVERWFMASNRGFRAAKSLGPAVLAFQYLDADEKLEAFLHPPEGIGREDIALIHYRDKAGKTRVEPWVIDPEGKDDRPRLLPDSDLTVAFESAFELPPNADVFRMTGEGQMKLAQFKVRRGDGPEVGHYAWAWLPMLTSVIPAARGEGGGKELVHIDYFKALPRGPSGIVEVAGMPDGRLFYRSVNNKGLKASGRLEKGRVVPVLGGGDMPMSVSLRVDEFIPSGGERLTFEQIDLPVGKLNDGIPAALAELTVDGETQEVWLRRSGGFDPRFEVVTFKSGRKFEAAYDVDRKPLGFKIALDDFEVGLDPGTQEPSSYRSDVRLTDEAQGIKDRPVVITMNEPMSHRGYMFYQSNYIPVLDKNRNKTGEYMSVFQVGHDPGRAVKYAGCLLVVMGVFVQFYMRAGVFTDGGKREREQAARKAARRAGKADAPSPADDATDVEPL